MTDKRILNDEGLFADPSVPQESVSADDENSILRELDCKNREKKLFCGGWQKNFFSNFLQNHIAG